MIYLGELTSPFGKYHSTSDLRVTIFVRVPVAVLSVDRCRVTSSVRDLSYSWDVRRTVRSWSWSYVLGTKDVTEMVGDDCFKLQYRRSFLFYLFTFRV